MLLLLFPFPLLAPYPHPERPSPWGIVAAAVGQNWAHVQPSVEAPPFFKMSQAFVSNKAKSSQRLR